MKSAQDEVLEVDAEAAKLSKVIQVCPLGLLILSRFQTAIEDGSGDEVIPLPNVKSTTLRKVIGTIPVPMAN